MDGTKPIQEDVYVRGGDVKQILHWPQIKVPLSWCCETACPDVFTAAFPQVGDGDPQEVSQFTLGSVRMRPVGGCKRDTRLKTGKSL